MLSTLIKVRLKGMFSRVLTKSSKTKKVSKVTIIAFLLLAIYLVAVFYFMFSSLFDMLLPTLKEMSLEWVYFSFVGILAFLLSFLGSIFLAQQEIYNAKDNDLLLSMPIKERDILLSRIFSILILNYIYAAMVYIPAGIVYIRAYPTHVIQLLLYAISFLTLPFLILSVTCFFGWVFANIMSRIKHKNIVVLGMYILFLGAYFYVVFVGQTKIFEFIMQGDKIASVIQNMLPPIYYMSIGIEEVNIIYFIIYLLCMIIPFAIVVYLLQKNFIVLSTHKPKVKHIAYVEKEMKVSSMRKALLIREFKHYVSNPIIILNASLGIIFTIGACVACVYFIIDGSFLAQVKLMLVLMPKMSDYIVPVLILIVCGTSSMNIISASSISLEGNRLWIIKSMPIPTFTILETKLWFHLIACIPSGILLSLILGYMMELSVIEYILIVCIPMLFTMLIALLGLLINLWKPKFDWINETAVVKQGMPVLITMFSAMGLVALFPILYLQVFYSIVDINQFLYILMILLVIINNGLYYLLKTWGVKTFNHLSA